MFLGQGCLLLRTYVLQISYARLISSTQDVEYGDARPTLSRRPSHTGVNHKQPPGIYGQAAKCQQFQFDMQCQSGTSSTWGIPFGLARQVESRHIPDVQHFELAAQALIDHHGDDVDNVAPK